MVTSHGDESWCVRRDYGASPESPNSQLEGLGGEEAGLCLCFFVSGLSYAFPILLGRWHVVGEPFFAYLGDDISSDFINT